MPRAASPLAQAALLAAVTLALALPAGAQVAPTVSLGAPQGALTLEPGQTATLAIAVQSQSAAGGTVALAVEGAADGWTASISPAQVPAGQQGQATLTVRAPADRAGGAAQFPLAVTATLATPTGTATDRLAVQAALAAAPPAPPPPFPWLELGLASAAVVGAVAAVLVRRETGVRLAVPAAPAEARPGHDAMVPLLLRNTSARPRVAVVRSGPAPEGWAVGVNTTRMLLQPHESRTLWLAVRPHIDWPPGNVPLTLAAKPAEAFWGPRPATLTVRVGGRNPVPAAPEAPGQAAPAA